MNKTGRARFALCLAVFTGLFAQTQTILATTLMGVYQHASESDHEYLAARATYAAGLEQKKIGRAGLLPSLNARAQLTDFDNTVTREGVSNSENSQGTQTNYQVSLEQPLLNMASWSEYQRSAALSSISAITFAAEQESLILRTATSYFEVLRTKDNLDTAQAEEKALSSQLDQIKQRYEVGLTAITEVHEAQAAFDSAVAERLIAEGRFGIAFEALEVLTGRAYESLSPLKDDASEIVPSQISPESWQQLALTHNKALRIAELQAKAARHAAKAQKANHYPVINAEAAYTDEETDFDEAGLGGFQLSNSEGTSIGITVSLPLFNGGSVSASRRRAAQEYIAAKESFSKAKRDTLQSTRSALVTVRTSISTLKARKQAIVSNQSALDATQAGYDVGTRDFVDVLNAQRNLFRAQRDYFTALYSLILSELELKQAAGTLALVDLEELEKRLETSSKISRF